LTRRGRSIWRDNLVEWEVARHVMAGRSLTQGGFSTEQRDPRPAGSGCGAGRDKVAAIVATGGTSSKAVLFSGSSFVVALLGLLLVSDTILRSLALGAIIVGLVTMAAAVTLLPALLALLGDRVNALRLPFFGRQQPAESPFWTRAVGAVVRRPAAALTAGVLILLAAALPVLGLHTGSSGINSLPDDTFAKSGALALERSFPGNSTADPAEVVISGDVASTDVTAAIERFEASIADDPDFGPSRQQVAANGQVALISIPLVGDPDHAQARRGLERLRTDLIPAAFDGTDTSVLVGGTTAENVDYSDVINHWLPIVLAFVLGLSFLLLTLVFRSLVLSATAVILNLLSVGAAYGLLVLVFQNGFAADWLGFQQVERVEAWVPVFLFSVLFALSMDYHVFLLSRIRERYSQTGDTVEAVVHGIAATGRIITGAALIIVVVFAGFAAGDLVMFQQMGFGVGVALLVGRHPHPHGRGPRGDDPPRPLELVPTQLVELATRAARRGRPRTANTYPRNTPTRTRAGLVPRPLPAPVEADRGRRAHRPGR
jgi:uncharacterized membrane protein YdfJ with MMPL/SSD domain